MPRDLCAPLPDLLFLFLSNKFSRNYSDEKVQDIKQTQLLSEIEINISLLENEIRNFQVFLTRKHNCINLIFCYSSNAWCNGILNESFMYCVFTFNLFIAFATTNALYTLFSRRQWRNNFCLRINIIMRRKL